MAEQKTVAEMISEMLRDVAILLLVFAPLDAAFATPPRLTPNIVGGIVGIAAALFVLGIVIERVRE